MNTFTGHMKASMTVQEELSRLDTIQDVLEHPDIVPVIMRGSTFAENFMVRLNTMNGDFHLLKSYPFQKFRVVPV